MAIAEFIAQALFELPGAGIAWVLQRTTRMSRQTAELVASLFILGVIAGACFVAWAIYQST